MRLGLGFTFTRWGRYKHWLIISIAMVLASTAAEVLVPLFVGKLTDALQLGTAGKHAALTAFGAITALTVAPFLLGRPALICINELTIRVMQDVVRDSFYRLQRFSTDWHANNFAGSVVRKITRGMWALDALAASALLGVLPAMLVLGGTIVLLTAHWPVLGIAMTIGAALYIVLAVYISAKIVVPAARRSNRWDTAMGGAIADAISAISVVKGFAGEEREDRRVERLVVKWKRRIRRTWGYSALGNIAQLALLWVVRSLVTGAAIWLWASGKATTGDVLYVLTTYLVIQGYLRDIGFHINQLQRSLNDMEEMVRLNDEPLGIVDAHDARPIAITSGEIRFERVGFHYGGHRTPLYDKLDVTIPAGQRIALVGSSGSGKTTFVKLVQRLYDVTQGRITIDGEDIRDVSQASLRKQIAVVAQEPILFHRSVAENIAYSRPGATRAEVELAATLANAHDFITRLPLGYGTLVGERGIKLSGGERQRIALARAFLANAPILILDEATSSLDSESELLIQKATERLMQGRTAIVIAHRLSTIRALDRILVFDRGRIVEDGTHEELMAIPGGRYRALSDHQQERRGKAA